jgi:hypothetical protein
LNGLPFAPPTTTINPRRRQAKEERLYDTTRSVTRLSAQISGAHHSRLRCHVALRDPLRCLHGDNDAVMCVAPAPVRLSDCVFSMRSFQREGDRRHIVGRNHPHVAGSAYEQP